MLFIYIRSTDGAYVSLLGNYAIYILNYTAHAGIIGISS